jgi:hypothetical protein
VTTLYGSLTRTDKCPQSVTVSTSRFLTTNCKTAIYNILAELHAQNIAYKVFSSQPNFQLSTPATNSFRFPCRTELSCNLVLLFGTDHVRNTAFILSYFGCRIIKNLLPSKRRCVSFAGIRLLSLCPETALVYPPISLSLHSNGSTRYSMLTVNGLHDIISQKIALFISSLVLISLSLRTLTPAALAIISMLNEAEYTGRRMSCA